MLYSVNIADWFPNHPGNNYVTSWGSHSSPTNDGYPAVWFIIPTRPGTTDIARNLPRAETVEAWREFKAFYPGLEFVGQYTPGYYNPDTGNAYAIPNSVSGVDFLTALEAAQTALRDGSAPANFRPFVFERPTTSRFTPGAIPELEEEPTTVSFMPSTATTKVTDDHESLGLRTCSQCGRMGHNTRTCDGTQRSYDKIGIEIEGRWRNLAQIRRDATALTGSEGYQDGSVNRGSTPGVEAWEFQTKPGSLSQALNQLHTLYPDEADQTCGMHVHVSFAPTDLFLLNTTEFFTYFHTRWTEWGTRMRIRRGSEFWKRLNGENDYCRVNTAVERNMTGMDRYYQLNFSAWERHKTVECRLLPMFKHERLALAAVQELVSIYEDWFAQDHSALYPETNVSLPDYRVVPDITAYTVEPPACVGEDYHEVGVLHLPPPAAGLTRVVIPTGRTMDNTSVLDRFQTIAQERQAA